MVEAFFARRWRRPSGFLIAAAIVIPGIGPAQAVGTTTPGLGQATKTHHCLVRGALPDPDCTPGDIFSDATKADVCRPGYSAAVRYVTLETKRQLYQAYGIDHHAAGEYELDHLIPLELGGSNAAANLWPEAALPTPGFHEKDTFENYLHDKVCSGSLQLTDAQHMIANDWLSAYQQAGFDSPLTMTNWLHDAIQAIHDAWSRLIMAIIGWFEHVLTNLK